MREKTEKLSADGAWDWMLRVFGWTQYMRGVAREMSQGTINANQRGGGLVMWRKMEGRGL